MSKYESEGMLLTDISKYCTSIKVIMALFFHDVSNKSSSLNTDVYRINKNHERIKNILIPYHFTSMLPTVFFIPLLNITKYLVYPAKYD